MIGRLLTRPCVIRRRSDSGQVNDYGDPVFTEVEVATTCELQQNDRTEGQGDLSDTTWSLFLAADEQIDSSDAVIVDGQAFELVGDPWRAWNPRARSAGHIEATLRRTA